MIKFWVQR